MNHVNYSLMYAKITQIRVPIAASSLRCARLSPFGSILRMTMATHTLKF